MAQSVLDRVFQEKIIAIVRGIPSGQIVSLARALAEGGVSCVEVTFDQTAPEETLTSLRAIKAELGDNICLGAGTVMTAEQVDLAVQAGAEYMISPNVDKTVIQATKALGKVSIPGAMTPSEAAFAWQCGADIVKLFPAGLLGPAYVKALKAPLKHIPVTAVGNITVDNCIDFIQAGAAGVGVGGSLVSPLLVKEGHFDKITATARAYREKLK